MKLPKLHLRDLFWLTLVVAMGLGWFGHYGIMQREYWHAQDRVDSAELKVKLLTSTIKEDARLRAKTEQPIFPKPDSAHEGGRKPPE